MRQARRENQALFNIKESIEYGFSVKSVKNNNSTTGRRVSDLGAHHFRRVFCFLFFAFCCMFLAVS
jgi:hypothetical protein